MLGGNGVATIIVQDNQLHPTYLHCEIALSTSDLLKETFNKVH